MTTWFIFLMVGPSYQVTSNIDSLSCPSLSNLHTKTDFEDTFPGTTTGEDKIFGNLSGGGNAFSYHTAC